MKTLDSWSPSTVPRHMRASLGTVRSRPSSPTTIDVADRGMTEIGATSRSASPASPSGKPARRETPGAVMRCSSISSTEMGCASTESASNRSVRSKGRTTGGSCARSGARPGAGGAATAEALAKRIELRTLAMGRRFGLTSKTPSRKRSRSVGSNRPRSPRVASRHECATHFRRGRTPRVEYQPQTPAAACASACGDSDAAAGDRVPNRSRWKTRLLWKPRAPQATR